MMKIDLKDIEMHDFEQSSMLKFTAWLYIDEIKAALVQCLGNGKTITYSLLNKDTEKLIQNAEQWCASFYPNLSESFKNPSSKTPYLDIHINELAWDHAQQLNKANLLERMSNGIVYGIPGGDVYTTLTLPESLPEVLKNEAKAQKLKGIIHEQVLPKLVGKIKILNPDIPAEMWEKLGVPKDKVSPMPRLPPLKVRWMQAAEKDLRDGQIKHWEPAWTDVPCSLK